ncbi:MAG: metal-sulfur cluster assembly factor, partial [archaeon]
ELGFSIVDLGLIYEVKIEGEKVRVKMTLTSPACPIGPQLLANAKGMVEEIEGVKEAEVELVFSPPWEPSMAKGEARAALEQFM